MLEALHLRVTYHALITMDILITLNKVWQCMEISIRKYIINPISELEGNEFSPHNCSLVKFAAVVWSGHATLVGKALRDDPNGYEGDFS